MKNLVTVAIILLVAMLFPTRCRASGTLSLSQSVVNSNQGQSHGPTVSLYVYEFISPNWNYQSWTGVVGGKWFDSEHAIMRRVGNRLNLGIGPAYESSGGLNNTSLKVYGEFHVW